MSLKALARDLDVSVGYLEYLHSVLMRGVGVVTFNVRINCVSSESPWRSDWF